jgi:1-acyl-sn-glycerol-3-phosphate acyltransferase
MIRTLFIYICVVLVTFVFGLAAIFVSFFSRSGNTAHKVAYGWAKSIIGFSGVKVNVTGVENIHPENSYIYMCNHQSNFDIPVLLAYLPVQFRWLAKAELFKIPVFGQGMRGAGYISIDRSDQESAFRSISEAAQKIKNGVSVMIFPEGTRSKDGKIKSFKKGGFVLAVDSGIPIVPVIIKGTYAIMSKGNLRINPGPVDLEIQKPIETCGYTRESKEALMDRVKTVMREHFTTQ